MIWIDRGRGGRAVSAISSQLGALDIGKLRRLDLRTDAVRVAGPRCWLRRRLPADLGKGARLVLGRDLEHVAPGVRCLASWDSALSIATSIASSPYFSIPLRLISEITTPPEIIRLALS